MKKLLVLIVVLSASTDVLAHGYDDSIVINRETSQPVRIEVFPPRIDVKVIKIKDLKDQTVVVEFKVKTPAIIVYSYEGSFKVGRFKSKRKNNELPWSVMLTTGGGMNLWIIPSKNKQTIKVQSLIGLYH